MEKILKNLKLLSEDKIIGVSAGSLKEALKAQEDGADYIGVGAMYSTGTKKDATGTTMDELKEIRKNISIPIVVIGGINKERVKNFEDTNIDGLAIVSAIIAQTDITKATKEFKELFLNIK